MLEQPSILPPNSTALQRAIEDAIAGGRPDLSPVRRLLDPETCPADLLGWLAWSFSVEIWDPAWTEETKRNVIAASIDVHRRKGTVAAVKRAIRAAGYNDAELIERANRETYNGTRTHDGVINHEAGDHWAEYRVRLTRPITIAQAALLRALLEAVAPARCHLKALIYPEADNLYDARIRHDGQFTHGVA